ncbi:hypothetical protein [Asanoa sp. NPDC050611]|uniref:hypothetical protein n=1 Tax=Asanoa sp. NPDC050611 TaxID=3157098 RepID=UPI0033FC264C
MKQLIVHPDWCRRLDCANEGVHVSGPLKASLPNDLVGIEATLHQLDDCGMRLIQLAFTDDGETTAVFLSNEQLLALARTLHDLDVA